MRGGMRSGDSVRGGDWGRVVAMDRSGATARDGGTAPNGRGARSVVMARSGGTVGNGVMVVRRVMRLNGDTGVEDMDSGPTMRSRDPTRRAMTLSMEGEGGLTGAHFAASGAGRDHLAVPVAMDAGVSVPGSLDRGSVTNPSGRARRDFAARGAARHWPGGRAGRGSLMVESSSYIVADPVPRRSSVQGRAEARSHGLDIRR